VPRQLVFYDIKTHLAENSQLVETATPIQIMASSATASSTSGLKNS
jgi:hypothetical protein